MHKILSLIIPVYGVEKYIQEFVSSLIDQVNQEVELIVVDDGCLDSSIEIMKNVISKYPQNIQDCFIFLKQENQGQSAARNYGLTQAKGDFVGFLDPDDIVYPSYIDTLTKQMKLHPDVDVFHINALEIDEKSIKQRELVLVDTEGLIENDTFYIFELIKQDLWQPWFRFFSKKHIINLNFRSGILLEDKYLFSELYNNKIATIMNVNKYLIGYRVHSKSSLNNEKNLDKLILSAKEGVLKYGEYNDKNMSYVFLSYLNLYIGLVSKINIDQIRNKILELNSYYKKAKKINKIKLSEKIKFNFPVMYAKIRHIVRIILKV
ncbi:glycosyltransferase family 2 protein [Acinetobacter soli]|uniref:Glycosyltransferase n=1 Tax=Acinetobacter soli TaxID=487316 RepID=A0AB38YYQ1_9GAMM|nr:glycosyltransferase [Acinetobacter soli]WND06309.1 glycosyltransferase [Acinetobacter soli]